MNWEWGLDDDDDDDNDAHNSKMIFKSSETELKIESVLP